MAIPQNSNMTASDLMTFPVLKVSSVWTLGDVVRFFSKYRISRAPVIDTSGRTVGVIEIGDIMNGHLGGDNKTQHPHDIEKSYLESLDSGNLQSRKELQDYLESTKAEDYMQQDFLCVERTASMEDVVHLLKNENRHQVFVCDNNRVVGVISSIDLVRLFTE